MELTEERQRAFLELRDCLKGELGSFPFFFKGKKITRIAGFLSEFSESERMSIAMSILRDVSNATIDRD